MLGQHSFLRRRKPQYAAGKWNPEILLVRLCRSDVFGKPRVGAKLESRRISQIRNLCRVFSPGRKQKPINFGNISVPHGYASTAGVETSLIRNFNRHVGLKADFSAHFNDENGPGNVIICNPACTTATQTIQFRTRVYNFLVGPELKARNHTRFTPFVYALGGLAHTNARFNTPGPTFNLLLRKSTNDFAMALGGGLDLRTTKRISIRGSIDYNPIFIGDSSGGTRNLVRLSLGVLFH